MAENGIPEFSDDESDGSYASSHNGSHSHTLNTPLTGGRGPSTPTRPPPASAGLDLLTRSSFTHLTWTGFVFFVLYYMLGVLLSAWLEPQWEPIHWFYFTAVSITTVGYGDFYPENNVHQILNSIYLLVGLSLVGLYLTLANSELQGKMEECLVRRDKPETKKAKKAHSSTATTPVPSASACCGVSPCRASPLARDTKVILVLFVGEIVVLFGGTFAFYAMVRGGLVNPDGTNHTETGWDTFSDCFAHATTTVRRRRQRENEKEKEKEKERRRGGEGEEKEKA